jgi:Bacterial membrane protein YfhO
VPDASSSTIGARRRDGVHRLVLAAWVASFFLPALVLRGVYFYGDVSHYLPRLAFTAESLRAGNIPLWNPYLSLGGPHAADAVSMPWYPPHVLLFLLGGPTAYNYDVVLHVLLAALGAFSLARAWGQTRTGALIAGSCYGLGGYTTGHLQHLNILVALAWVPFLLSCAERYLTRDDRRSLGLAGAVLGLQIMGGHPQIVAYGLLGLFAHAALKLGLSIRREPPRLLAGRALGLAAVVVLALGLAAVSWLPFVEWMLFVSRGERMTPEYATSFSLPPNRLWALVAPFWFGGSLGRPWGGASLVECSSYVGLLPLALVPMALARPGWRVLFLAAVAVLAALLSLGASTSLYNLVVAAPVLGWVRAPSRWLLLVTLALSLLAGFGFDVLRAGGARRVARVLAGVLLALAGVVLGCAVGPGWLRKALPSRSDAVRLDQPDTVAFLATLVGTAGLVYLLERTRASRRSVVALALVFTACDLSFFHANLSFNRLAPSSAFDEPSATALAVRADRGSARFCGWGLGRWNLGRMLYDEPDPESYQKVLREGILRSLPMRFGVQSLTGFGTEPPTHSELLGVIAKRGAFDSRSARLAGTFGVRYVLGIEGLTAPELTLVGKGLVNVYRNEVALPRAFLVPQSRVVANDRAAFAVLKHPDFDPRGTVVIEAPGPSMPPGPLGDARSTITDESPDRVVVQTDAERAAWLVLNDTFAPGWRASIDGRPAQLLRANSLVRAVPVEAGRHRVEFSYAPRSVVAGAGVSLFSLLLLAALIRGPKRQLATAPAAAAPGSPSRGG